jgi:ferrous-iron efflux pump FieF
VKDEQILRHASTVSLLTALVLTVVKFVTWLATGSASLFASMADSALDVVSSGANFAALRIALRPADTHHRFGHGKAESLAGLGQAIFIGASAAGTGAYAVSRLIEPQEIELAGVGLAVMVFSIVLTGALIRYQRRVIRRTGSLVIQADSLHYLSDWLANIGVIVAILLAQFGFLRADGGIALGISLMIAWSAWSVARDAADVLMDRELPASERERILELARDEAGVTGVHGLRTRRSGVRRIIQLHLELPGRTALEEAHAAGDRLRDRLTEEFGAVDVTVHLDPAGPDNPGEGEVVDPVHAAGDAGAGDTR